MAGVAVDSVEDMKVSFEEKDDLNFDTLYIIFSQFLGVVRRHTVG